MAHYFRQRFAARSEVETSAAPRVGVRRITAALGVNRVPVAVFAISRACIVLAMYLSLVLFGKPAGYQVFPDNLLVDGLVRWDSFRYAAIADNGYTNVPDENGFRDTSWFPLYPATISVVERVVGSVFTAGLLVSNLCYLVGLVLLYHLTVRLFDPNVARRAVILISIFPFSFFFSSIYSESLFFVTAVAAFYFGEKQRWLPAAICAALAAATHILGIGVAMGLVVLYLEQIDFQPKRIRLNMLWLLIAPLGLVAVMALMARVSGDPFQFVSPENTAPFLEIFRLSKLVDTVRQMSPRVLASGSYFGMDFIHVVTLAGMIVVAVASWKALPRKAYAVWASLSCVAMVVAWPEFGRNVLPVFPLFITLAVLLSSRERFQAWAFLSTIGLSVFSMVFAVWRYVA